MNDFFGSKKSGKPKESSSKSAKSDKDTKNVKDGKGAKEGNKEKSALKSSPKSSRGPTSSRKSSKSVKTLLKTHRTGSSKRVDDKKKVDDRKRGDDKKDIEVKRVDKKNDDKRIEDKPILKKEEPIPSKETTEETTTVTSSVEENKVIVVGTLEQYSDLRNSGLVVVDFNTTWCGPCKSFAPLFEEIASRYPGVVFLSVDAEKIEHKDCESVSKVPTFRVFLNGVTKREFSGIDKEKLERYIQRYQVQILVNGDVQKSFPESVREKVITYMSMLQPEDD